MVNYKTATTQKEFDNNFMRAVTKNARGLVDIDIVDNFFIALGVTQTDREFVLTAVNYEYEYVLELAQSICKELGITFVDKTQRKLKVLSNQREAIKKLKALEHNEPKPEPKRACYLKELNTAELAVKPIRIMPNIYFGFDNSGNSYEYKREDTYIEALKITKPRKIKVTKVAIRTAVTTAKAQKTDIWKEAQIALIAEYNHKVKELLCA